MNYEKMQAKVYNRAVSKGWWDDDEPNIPEKLMLIVSEISEALEVYRDCPDDADLDDIVYGPNDKPEGFAVELADAVIRIMDLCEYLGIDLASVIRQKDRYNATRPFRHGGKRC